MKSSAAEIVPILGTSMGGGFYAGRILIDNVVYALIAAPKAEGEKDASEWIAKYKDVPGAKSYFDGLANTKAMAEAKSKLAIWTQALRIGGHDDWYLPAQDELEIIYRNLKPTTEQNSQYHRSGINLSSFDPTYPYTPDLPAQTLAEAFQAGGEQAFEADWYWSSTQLASGSDYAWFQIFDGGNQSSGTKGIKLRARAVRRLAI